MERLEQTLSAAAGRLRWAKLVRAMSRALLAGVAGSCAALAAARLTIVPPAGWIAAAIAVAAGLIGVVVALSSRLDMLRAALHLDEALGLRERMSTAVVCLRRSDGPARLVVRDATAQLHRVNVRRDCPVALPWEAVALFVLVLCAVVLARLHRAGPDRPDAAAVAQRELEAILQAIGRAEGAAPPGAARRTLDEMKNRLRPAGAPGEIATQIAATLAQLEGKIRRLEALSNVAQAALPPDARSAVEQRDEQALRAGARAVGEKIDNKQLNVEQRDLLKQALKEAHDRSDDPEVKRALQDALEALNNNDGQKAAEALEKILLALAAEVRLKELQKLRNRLAVSRENIDAASGDDGDSVVRNTQAGRGDPIEPDAHQAPWDDDSAFWQELPAAQARAEGAVADGTVPERHRELVGRYFARPTE